MVAEALKQYLDQQIPPPSTPETIVEDRFTPGPFVIRAQVCNSYIEHQYPHPERAINGLHEAVRSHIKLHEHEGSRPCQPVHITPLLRKFINHSTPEKETIIKPVQIGKPAEDARVDYIMTAIFELPDAETNQFPNLYLKELPKELPKTPLWKRLTQVIFRARA